MKKSIIKLSLNKLTISNLDNAIMSQKLGGIKRNSNTTSISSETSTVICGSDPFYSRPC